MPHRFLLGVLLPNNHSILQGYPDKEAEQACASEKGTNGSSGQPNVSSKELGCLQT
jgi:hypothetical protein